MRSYVLICPLALVAMTGVSRLDANPLALRTEHVDVAVDYDAGAWRFFWNDKDTPGEYLPGEALAEAGLSSQIDRPVGVEWDFAGVGAGQPFYVFPQSQDPALPFVGVGAETISSGVFSTPVSLRLVNVSGPGAFSLYQTDEFGSPSAFLASADGLTVADTLGVPVGSHIHYNWGFSRVGTYDLTFVASATLVGGSSVTSDPATFRFVVVPEPASLAAIGLLGLALVRRR